MLFFGRGGTSTTPPGLLDDFEGTFSHFPQGWSGQTAGSSNPGPGYQSGQSWAIGTNSSGSGTTASKSYTVPAGYNRFHYFKAGYQGNYDGSFIFNGSYIYPNTNTSTGITASGYGTWYEVMFIISGSGTLTVNIDGAQAVGYSLGQGTGTQCLIDRFELVTR